MQTKNNQSLLYIYRMIAGFVEVLEETESTQDIVCFWNRLNTNIVFNARKFLKVKRPQHILLIDDREL